MAVERRLLIDAFAVLQKSISPVIDELTSELYSAKLVGVTTRDNDQGSPMDKAKRVLSAVECSIDTNPRNYYIFQETLGQFSVLDSLVSYLVKRKGELEKSFPTPHQVADNGGGNSNSQCVGIAPHYTGNPPQCPHAHQQVHHHFYLGTSSSDQTELTSMMSELQLQLKSESGVDIASHPLISSPPEVGVRNAVAMGLLTPTPVEALPLAGEDKPVSPFHRNMSEGQALKEKGCVAKDFTCMKPIQEEKPPCPTSPSFLDVPTSRDVTDSLCSVSSSISSYSSQPSTEDDECELMQLQEQTWNLYKQTMKKNKILSHKLKQMGKRLKCTQGREIKLRKELEKAHARDDDQKKLREELKLTQEDLEEKSKQHDKLLEEIVSQEAQVQTLKSQLELTINKCEKLKDRVHRIMAEALDERRLMLSYKQKYEQLKDEKGNDYYERYCEAKKESEQLHRQLMECQMKNASLEQRIDYLLKNDIIVTNCEEDGCDQDLGIDSQLEPA